MSSSAEAHGGTRCPVRRLRIPARAAFLSVGMVLFAQGADPGVVAAQAVRGEIRDAETRQPVPSARVVVRNEADSVLSELTAGASGEFTLLGLPRGRLVLEVSALGYAASAETTIDHEGESLFLAVELDPDPLATEGIRVRVESQDAYLADRGYYRRERVGHGYFLDPTRMSVVRPSDMFRRIAAMKVVGEEPVIARGTTSLVQDCRPAVYQDGMLIRSEHSKAPFNDVVAPAVRIQAVEVYPGPATAPPQWRSSAACGLIVVWTRH